MSLDAAEHQNGHGGPVAAVVAAGSQGRVHAHGYRALPDVDLVAIADPDPVAAAVVARMYGIARTYDSHVALLASEHVDVLSVCTPPASHRQVVADALAHGVRAIHCEKPMALRWEDARWMHARAAELGVRLSINHQRRLDPVHRSVRDAIAAGEIGEVIRVAGSCANLFDWGSHVVDLMRFYVGDSPVAWVLAQAELRTRKRVYGALTETAAVARIHWQCGVEGVILTGDLGTPGSTRNGLTVEGDRGWIRVTGGRAVIGADGRSVQTLAQEAAGTSATQVDGVNPAIVAGTMAALRELIEATRGVDRAPAELTLDSRHGLAAAEVIFAAYESAIRRDRVVLPLDITDNPLERGLDQGLWHPVGETHGTS